MRYNDDCSIRGIIRYTDPVDSIHVESIINSAMPIYKSYHCTAIMIQGKYPRLYANDKICEYNKSNMVCMSDEQIPINLASIEYRSIEYLSY